MKRVKNLLTKGDAKTSKGNKLGWTTNILYMSPHKQNASGKNLCPHASAGCAAACLFTAGRGKMSSIQKARINKSELFIHDRDWFLDKLVEELEKIQRRVDKGSKECVRLNGTTDIPWENIEIELGANIMECFPDIQFYDYTKSPNRFNKDLPNNYHLTFSRSETNQKDCELLLENGVSVAAVYNREFHDRIFHKDDSAYTNFAHRTYKIINGDKHDLRFLDDENVIVALRAKGDAAKDKSGFVI